MKNIFLITLLVFIYSCGYTSVYKNLERQDIIIVVTETKGDRAGSKPPICRQRKNRVAREPRCSVAVMVS